MGVWLLGKALLFTQPSLTPILFDQVKYGRNLAVSMS